MKRKKRPYRTPTERKLLLRYGQSLLRNGMPRQKMLKRIQASESTFYLWQREARG